MNRLWFRITAALVGITLLSLITVTIVAQVNTQAQFEQLAGRQREIAQSVLLDTLHEYYVLNGGWNGAEHVLQSALPNFPQAQPPPGARNTQRRQRDTVRFVLADDHDNVVAYAGAAPRANRFDAAERRAALPIEIDGRLVGHLLVDSPELTMLGEAQQLVLNQLRRYAIISALIVGVASVLFGVLSGRALAAPLTDLAGVAQRFSSRRWDVRAHVRGAQEVADVAQAFNEMADSLERAEINRRNLTADIAHELRTPLTVIQGNLRAMLDGVYPLERGEIATIYDETRLLSRLVEDLRLLALAEARQLQLQMRDESAQALMHAAAAQYQVAADAAGVRLQVIEPDVDVIVRADADRAGQVLRNLLSNALRYTPAGGTITMHMQGFGEALCFAVQDTGAGISADALPHIFDRFYRGDASRVRSGNSTGLGLAIVQSLVQAMGGSIGAESTLGVGSTLWFELKKTTADG
ncbi:MAG: ATP-binding protein [Chloroflexi bacterium]|nr:ATP-binding protein [Chloroflexota bacterium]